MRTAESDEVRSGVGQGGGFRGQDWKRPFRWLLWWRIGPKELRSQIEGYTTLKGITSTRGFSFFVTDMVGAGKAITLGLIYRYRSDAAGRAYARVLTGESVLLPLLGYLAYRSSAQALTLMALWSLDILLLELIIARSQVVNQDVFAHPVATIAPMLALALGWAFSMHPFYLARCVERQRRKLA